MTNPRAVVTGDVATLQMYVQAEHVLDHDEPDSWFTLGGRYDDRMVRTEAGWRIESVTLTILWRRGRADIMDLAIERGEGRRSARRPAADRRCGGAARVCLTTYLSAALLPSAEPVCSTHEEVVMGGPLEGVRVLDVSAVLSGPLTATYLADQGADVVKVEPPGMGDILRWLGSSRNGMSGMFCVTNRGKRSIVVDLSSPEGCAIFSRLAERADVVLQNFRPGVVDRMGIGYEAVRRTNPSVIYLSISGFGPQGPYAGKRVYDNIIQAYSGLADVQGDPQSRVPQLNRQLLCDKLTAYTAAQAVTAALFSRERTGAASTSSWRCSTPPSRSCGRTPPPT
jgi:hypothetical protein